MYKKIIILILIAVPAVFLIKLSHEVLSASYPVPEGSPPGNALTVASWNMHGGNTWYGTSNIDNINREFAKSLGKQDIVFLQEAVQGGLLDDLAKKYGYYKSGNRNTILSKYPILRSGVVAIDSRGARDASWSEVEYNNTIIRIYSIHLSYKVDNWFYIPEVRGAELKTLIDHAGSFGGPIIIAGDFNTVNLVGSKLDDRPVFQEAYRAGFKNAFKEQDCNTQMILGRVDWVFYKGMSAWFSGCGNFSGSDHRWMQETFIDVSNEYQQSSPANSQQL